MSQQAPGKGMGRIFMIVAWCAGLYLATQFFGRVEQRQQNPNTEALSLDTKGAWIGVDNGNHVRADGEKRPVVWRFAAPQGGWSAKQ